MTLSLRSRILSGLARPNKKYGGHRTLESVIATVETLLRQRGDINESAVRVIDLEGVMNGVLQFHIDVSHSGTTQTIPTGNEGGVSAGGGGSDGPPPITEHSELSGLTDDDHPQYHNDARGDARYSQLAHNHTGTYVRLIGDTMTGNLIIDKSVTGGSATAAVYSAAGQTARFLIGVNLVAHADFISRPTVPDVALRVLDPAGVGGGQLTLRAVYSGPTELYYSGGTFKLATSATGGTLAGVWNALTGLQVGGVNVSLVTHTHPSFAGAGTVGFVPDPVTANGYVLNDGGMWVPRFIGASGAVEANFRFDSSTVVGDPGAGDIRLNNAVQNSATAILVSDETINGVPILTFWLTLRVGDFVMIVKNSGLDGGKVYKVTGTPTLNGVAPNEWVNVPIESPVYATTGADFVNNGNIRVGLIYTPDSRLPIGGTTKQALLKTSAANYATQWAFVDWADLTGKPATFPPDLAITNPLYVKLVGDTMTGTLTISTVVAGLESFIQYNTDATKASSTRHLVNGVLRARSIYQPAAVPETYSIQMYDAAGGNAHNQFLTQYGGFTRLYHAGSIRFETTVAGGTLTGTWNADALAVIGQSTHGSTHVDTTVAGQQNAVAITPQFQSHGVGQPNTANAFYCWSSNVSASPAIIFARSLASVVGTHAAVVATPTATQLGNVLWEASNGAAFLRVCDIRVQVTDVIPSVPGPEAIRGYMAFRFSDSGGTMRERLTIDPNGQVVITAGNLSDGIALRVTQPNNTAGCEVVRFESAANDPAPTAMGPTGLWRFGHLAHQTATNKLEVSGGSIAHYTWTANTAVNPWDSYKSRGGAEGVHAVLVSSDTVWQQRAYGSDGESFLLVGQQLIEAEAPIVAAVIGVTPGKIPTRWRITLCDPNGVNTERMRINSSGNVGIGSAAASVESSLRITCPITGAVGAFGMRINSVIQSDVTASATIYNSAPGTQALAFTLGTLSHYTAANVSVGAGSAITNHYGFWAATGLAGVATALNVGFRSTLAVGATNWNFYADGTAQNAFAGLTRIGGLTAPTVACDVTGSVLATGSILTSGNSAPNGIGYAAGAGLAANQATSKSNSVNLNRSTGQITMFATGAINANSAVSFTVNNNNVAANDTPVVVILSGATAGAYTLTVDNVAAGSFRISVRNMTAGTLTEPLVLQFSLIKGVAA